MGRHSLAGSYRITQLYCFQDPTVSLQSRLGTIRHTKHLFDKISQQASNSEDYLQEQRVVAGLIAGRESLKP